MKISLYLALSDIALEYKQIIYGLLCQEGYASHSQLEMFPCTFSKIPIASNGKSEEMNSTSVSIVPKD